MTVFTLLYVCPVEQACHCYKVFFLSFVQPWRCEVLSYVLHTLYTVLQSHSSNLPDRRAATGGGYLMCIFTLKMQKNQNIVL